MNLNKCSLIYLKWSSGEVNISSKVQSGIMTAKVNIVYYKWKVSGISTLTIKRILSCGLLRKMEKLLNCFSETNLQNVAGT